MAEVQITLALHFKPLLAGQLRKSSSSEHDCLKVDDFWNRSSVDGYGVGGHSNRRTPLDFFTSMIAKRVEGLDAMEDLEYKTSAHEILNTISENLASRYNDKACFYLTNIDLGGRNAIFDTRGFLLSINDVDSLRLVPIE